MSRPGLARGSAKQIGPNRLGQTDRAKPTGPNRLGPNRLGPNRLGQTGRPNRLGPNRLGSRPARGDGSLRRHDVHFRRGC